MVVVGYSIFCYCCSSLQRLWLPFPSIGLSHPLILRLHQGVCDMGGILDVVVK